VERIGGEVIDMDFAISRFEWRELHAVSAGEVER
jgi:hypothetical protein